MVEKWNPKTWEDADGLHVEMMENDEGKYVKYSHYEKLLDFAAANVNCEWCPLLGSADCDGEIRTCRKNIEKKLA